MEPDMAGFVTEDFYNTLHQCNENAVTLEDIELWPEADKGDPGYHTLMEEEIVDNITGAKSSEGDEDDNNKANKIIEPKPNFMKYRTSGFSYQVC